MSFKDFVNGIEFAMSAADEELEHALNYPKVLEDIWRRKYLMRDANILPKAPTANKGRVLKFQRRREDILTADGLYQDASKMKAEPLKTVYAHDGMSMEEIFASIEAGVKGQE